MSESLASLGYEVCYVVCEPERGGGVSTGVSVKLLPRINHFFRPGASLCQLMLALAGRLRNSVLAFKHALAMCPDVVHCYEPDAWVVAVLIRWFTGAKVVAEILETYDSKAMVFPAILRPFVRKAVRLLMRFLAARTAFLIHVSHSRMKYYSFLGDSIAEVIHYYPDLRELPRSSVCKNQTGEFIVLHAGPLRDSYASRELLAAIDIARRRVPNLKCTVLGGIQDGSIELRELANRLTNEGLLTLIPRVPFEEVVEHMQNADVGISLVLPIDDGHRLAFPRKLFEYLAAGLPVIGSGSGDIGTTLEEWNCGLVVHDSGCPDEIARCIVRLACDEPLRTQMARNARLASEVQFNWAKELPRLARIYKEVTGGAFPGTRF